MIIKHLHTTTVAKGVITVLKVEKDSETYGLVVMPESRNRPVHRSPLEDIEKAFAGQTIIDQELFLTSQRADEIEECLINWLARNEAVTWTYLSWQAERMYGFENEAKRKQFEEANIAAISGSSNGKSTGRKVMF